LVEEAWDSQVLLDHLLTLIQIVARKQKILKIDIDHGLIPFGGVAKFKCNLDNNGWSLKWQKDFLE